METAGKEDTSAAKLAMNLSLGAGVLMLVIKMGAYVLTGSAAILSDAAESVVHIVAVVFAWYSLRLSQMPADQRHPYGHSKIAFFSAGFEGAMIVAAAMFILYEAVRKFLFGFDLQNLGLGSGLVGLALGINAALGYYLLKVGRRENKLILVANGKHVLTDAWTSVGALLGVGLASLTGWIYWDPIFAIILALNILLSGAGLMRSSFRGLMDTADPEIQKRLDELLDRVTAPMGLSFHQVRHRDLGDSHWVDLHLLFDDETPVKEAHAMATVVEDAIRGELGGNTQISSHLEPRRSHRRAHPEGDPNEVIH